MYPRGEAGWCLGLPKDMPVLGRRGLPVQDDTGNLANAEEDVEAEEDTGVDVNAAGEEGDGDQANTNGNQNGASRVQEEAVSKPSEINVREYMAFYLFTRPNIFNS